MEELQNDFDLTYLFIAHDLAVVRHISDRIAVMYLGQIMELSPADDLYENPLHPYTISLLSAIPIPDPAIERNRKGILLQGDLPSPANPPRACRFHTRCPYVQETRCRDDEPELRPLEGHLVKCHFAEEIKAGEIQPRQREVVFEAGRAGAPRTSRRLSELSSFVFGTARSGREASGSTPGSARRGSSTSARRRCRPRREPGSTCTTRTRTSAGCARATPSSAHEELDVVALRLADGVDRQQVKHAVVRLLGERGLLSGGHVCDPPLEAARPARDRATRRRRRGARS